MLGEDDARCEFNPYLDDFSTGHTQVALLKRDASDSRLLGLEAMEKLLWHRPSPVVERAFRQTFAEAQELLSTKIGESV